jgi:hypothetical protein
VDAGVAYGQNWGQSCVLGTWSRGHHGTNFGLAWVVTELNMF